MRNLPADAERVSNAQRLRRRIALGRALRVRRVTRADRRSRAVADASGTAALQARAREDPALRVHGAAPRGLRVRRGERLDAQFFGVQVELSHLALRIRWRKKTAPSGSDGTP